MRARLTKDFCFEAAHHLPSLPEGHKCIQMHGHSFKVEISIEGEVDPKIGWIYDHKRISDAMKPLLELMDHSCLLYTSPSPRDGLLSRMPSSA